MSIRCFRCGGPTDTGMNCLRGCGIVQEGQNPVPRTDPPPLTEEDVRRIVREELARSHVLKIG